MSNFNVQAEPNTESLNRPQRSRRSTNRSRSEGSKSNKKDASIFRASGKISTKKVLSTKPEPIKDVPAAPLVCVETNPGPKSKKGNSSQPKKKKTVVVTVPRTVKKSLMKSLGGNSSAAAQYLKSILSPCVGAARIPDMSCIPSDTMSLLFESTFTTNATGNCGAIVNLLNAPTFKVESSGSIDSAFAFSSAGPFAALATLTAQAQVNRIVSACIDVQYVGSSLNNQGQLVFASTLGFKQNETDYGSLGSIQNGRTNMTIPLRNGGSVFYRPYDASCFDYGTLSGTSSVGQLQFHVTGAQASTAVISVRIQVNVEYIRINDTTQNSENLAIVADPQRLAEAVVKANQVPSILSRETADKAYNAFKSAANTFSVVSDIATKLYSGSKTIGMYL